MYSYHQASFLVLSAYRPSLFLFLCFQVPLSFYFTSSSVDSVWLGPASSSTVTISASYSWVLWVCVSTLLYLFSVCPFHVCVPYCSSLACFPGNLIYFSVLAANGFLLIPLHYCSFSAARRSNMHPPLTKGFYSQCCTSLHLSLIK